MPLAINETDKITVERLVALEKKYGGIQREQVKTFSPYDDRNKSKTWSVQGGDRMDKRGHGYAPFYIQFLNQLKVSVIVEIGVFQGTGLAMWSELYPDADIIGLDIDPDIFYRNLPKLKKSGAFSKKEPEIYTFDQYQCYPREVQSFLGNRNIQLVIDDGRHKPGPATRTFWCLFPYLDKEFVYFIEDIEEGASYFKNSLPDMKILSFGKQNKLTVITNHSYQ